MDPIVVTQVLGGIRRAIRYVRPGMNLNSAINALPSASTLVIAPGDYAGPITIPATKHDISIVGGGGRGSVAIVALTNGVALTNKAEDVSLFNIGLGGDGTGAGLVNTGRRFRAYGCKIEGGARAAVLSVGAEADIEDGTDGNGSDILLDDCEVCWAENGIVVQASNYGAVTQVRLKDCLFHNITTKHVTEQLAAGASAPVMFRDLELYRCIFREDEDGAPPTNYVDLNGDNGNTGMISHCTFPAALNSGLNLVSTGVLWVANYHPAGLSNGQPS